MAKKSTAKRADSKVRRIIAEASPNVSFEDGTDVLLRLGCLLFLEKVAQESHEFARLEESKTITPPVAVKAAKSVLSDMRQFA